MHRVAPANGRPPSSWSANAWHVTRISDFPNPGLAVNPRHWASSLSAHPWAEFVRLDGPVACSGASFLVHSVESRRVRFASSLSFDAKPVFLASRFSRLRMHYLILRPGPVLIARQWERDEASESNLLEELVVTPVAHERLFEFVRIDAAVTLGDVLGLLVASPVLKQVFRRDFAEELCAEAAKGARMPLVEDPSEAIEYLELFQEWSVDSSSNLYGPTGDLQLHGVGVALAEDAPDLRRTAGERVIWSISLTPLRELLQYPVRYNPDVSVSEDDPNAKAFGSEIARVKAPDVTLGQVLRGVLGELSFHGAPQNQAEVFDELTRRFDEVKSGTAKLIPFEEVFGEMYCPGCDALFDDKGGLTPQEIRSALRHIDDDENAAAWFTKAFDGTVVVKERFRNRTGREFRKAFRAAAR